MSTDAKTELGTVGHFRLEELLGKGGMGVVYRAVDLKLGRSVALKLLAPELVSTERVRSRFVREARAAAAVTHPHIAAVYEVGEDEDNVFIAMELVQGRSLREVLHAGDLENAQMAVGLALDVLDALETAHEAGIVHRDIKPDNVMLDRRGRAKLLDFGVAKALFAEGSAVAPEEGVATVSSYQTSDGLIVGTPGYMAPEQARGGQVDARTDIFSLGVLIVEMLGGKSPYQRETPMASVLAAASGVSASLGSLRPDLPPDFVAVVDKCLSVDPEDRWPDARSIADALRATEVFVDGPSRRLAAAPESSRTAVETAPTLEAPAEAVAPRRKSWWLLGAGVLAIATTSIYLATRPAPTAETPAGEQAAPVLTPGRLTERRLTFNPPDDWVVSAHLVAGGSRLVYQDSSGILRLDLDGSEPIPIPLPEEASERLFDVTATGELLLLGSVEHLAPLETYDISSGRLRPVGVSSHVAVFSPDGTRIAATTEHGIVVRDHVRGEEVQIAELEEGDHVSHLSWSPDGERVTWVRRHGAGGERVGHLHVAPATGGEPQLVMQDSRLILRGGMSTATFWTASTLIYVLSAAPGASHGAELWAQRIDADGATVGDAQEIHRWAEGTPVELERAADALVYLKMNAQSDVWAGALSRDATRLQQLRQVTRDERNDAPNDALSADDILFMSTRLGAWNVFHRRDGEVVRLADGPTWNTYPLRHDDAVLFYRLWVDESGAVSRSELARREADGSVRPLFETRSEAVVSSAGRPPPTTTVFRCEGGACVISEVEGERLVFRQFDPDSGDRQDAGCDVEAPPGLYQWALSPDAATIAYLGKGTELTFIDRDTCETSDKTLPGEGALGFIAFAPDGGSVIITGVHVLEHRYVVFSLGVEAGEPALLHTSTSELFGHPVVAHDGRTLSFATQEFDVDAWMLEGLGELEP